LHTTIFYNINPQHLQFLSWYDMKLSEGRHSSNTLCAYLFWLCEDIHINLLNVLNFLCIYHVFKHHMRTRSFFFYSRMKVYKKSVTGVIKIIADDFLTTSWRFLLKLQDIFTNLKKTHLDATICAPHWSGYQLASVRA